MPEPDNSLIAEFNARRSEEAFAALVRQHVNLVFATALRQVGDAGAAEEITQNVFVALALAAGKLGSHPTIAGWLHQTALNKSREWLRSELRRRRREQVAVTLDLARAEGDSVWSSLVPLLDEALLELREPDRQAVILHFLEGQTFHEVGSALGVGEDTARKRVNRCLDQLTHFFRRRGFAVPTLAAGAPIFALSSHAAPAGLVASVTTAGLAAHSAVSTSTLTLIKGALKIMAWTKAKTAIVVAGTCVLLAGGVSTTLFITAHRTSTEIGYDRTYLSNPAAFPRENARIARWRQNPWPAERQREEERIKSRQANDETVHATMIDLKPYLNAALTDSPASPVGNMDDNMAELPSGKNVFAGVPFDVKGSIQLNGAVMSLFKKNYPNQVGPIGINRSCAKIHLLHGSNAILSRDFDRSVAKLVLHYADGDTREINLVAGKQLFDWWAPLFTTGVDPRFLQTAPGTERAWTGSNPYIKANQPDESLVLYKSTFDNPRPDVTLVSLDYVSTMTEAAPFLVGLTVE